MRICGIIAEYNPFHNGHALHIRETRETTGVAYVVVAMSGSFTQRGEPAFLDKWTRARMALIGGADLVIELPANCALRAARDFARGGVKLLDDLGCTDISFGTEMEDLRALFELCDFLEKEDEAFLEALHKALDGGSGYAAAYYAAAEAALPEGEYREQQLQALKNPNATLAIEYIRAIRALHSDILPFAVHRKGSGYHDEAMHALASSTAIRKAVRMGHVEELRTALPKDVYYCCERAMRLGEMVDADRADFLHFALLRGYAPEELALLPDISEGLENRVFEVSRQSGSLHACLEALQTKRYTRARLRRLAAHALLGMNRSDAALGPAYARVLGYRRDSQKLIGILSGKAKIPLIVRAAEMGSAPNPFYLDVKATDMRALMLVNEDLRKAGQDFTQPPVVV